MLAPDVPRRFLLQNGLLILVLAGCQSRSVPEKAAPEPTLPQMTVSKVTAKAPIRHEVDWQGIVRQQRQSSMLRGPELFSQVEENEPKGQLQFSWYAIDTSQIVEPKTLRVQARGGSILELLVEEPVYFLSKTQSLAEGSPEEPPAAVSHFVAYKVMDSKKTMAPLDSGHSENPHGVLAFVCLPVEEWHHDEYFQMTNRFDCWLVYESAPKQVSTTISTLDQFGLNSLNLQSSEWLCHPARVAP